MVLSKGRPLFLTQIKWDLTLILTSHTKVRKVSSFGHNMYSEYSALQIEKKKVWIFNWDWIYTLNIHPRWISFFFVDFPWLFSISLILYFFLTLSWLSHVQLCSFQFWALNFVFGYNFTILPLSVNCKFHEFIFICFFYFVANFYSVRLTSFVTFQFSSC